MSRPADVKAGVARALRLTGRAIAIVKAETRALRSRPATGVRVSYGHERMPAPDAIVGGGRVKFQRLGSVFPHDPRSYSVLYLGSSSLPPAPLRLLRHARRRGAAVVLNQDGVAYPAWAGHATDRINRPLRALVHEADHVLYQSEFCRSSADRFLGRRAGPAEILYNAVDTGHFTPAAGSPSRTTLLLGGNQYQRYRLERAFEALAALGRQGLDADLLVSGTLAFAGDHGAGLQEARSLAERLGISDRVRYVGSYTQRDAPELLRQATLLLHTKVNDPCPGAVIEALACGLPVVYSASGGVPELVGDEAGVGVPTALDWEHDRPPTGEQFAEAILLTLEDLDARREAARRRAVERFDLGPWVQRHVELFEALRS